MYVFSYLQIPEATRGALGSPISDLIPRRAPNDEVRAMLAVPGHLIENDSSASLVLVTKQGIVKRTALSEYRRTNSRGLRALTIRDGDALCAALLSDPGGPGAENGEDLLLLSSEGRLCRFPLSSGGAGASDDEGEGEGEGEGVADGIRISSRTSMGVQGIRLRKGHVAIGGAVVASGGAGGTADDEEASEDGNEEVEAGEQVRTTGEKRERIMYWAGRHKKNRVKGNGIGLGLG